MRHIFYRIVAGLVLIAAIAGIAFIAYSAGVTRGEAINAQVPVTQSGGQVYPVYGPAFWWPFPIFGFFGWLAVIFLFFLALGAARRMLWGPRFGWHRMYRSYGPWREKEQGEDIPPYITEIHRRMHAADQEKPADPAAQKET